MSPSIATAVRGDAMPLEAKVHDFFPTYVKDEDLLSEDYGFCEAWRGNRGRFGLPRGAKLCTWAPMLSRAATRTFCRRCRPAVERCGRIRR